MSSRRGRAGSHNTQADRLLVSCPGCGVEVGRYTPVEVQTRQIPDCPRGCWGAHR